MKEKHLSTILVFVIAFIIFYLLYRNEYFLYAAIATGCIGLFIPSLSKKLHWAWMKLAEAIGFVMNKIILSVVFFIFLVPIAFLKKIFTKKRQDKKSMATYFVQRDFTYTKKSMEDPW